MEYADDKITIQEARIIDFAKWYKLVILQWETVVEVNLPQFFIDFLVDDNFFVTEKFKLESNNEQIGAKINEMCTTYQKILMNKHVDCYFYLGHLCFSVSNSIHELLIELKSNIKANQLLMFPFIKGTVSKKLVRIVTPSDSNGLDFDQLYDFESVIANCKKVCCNSDQINDDDVFDTSIYPSLSQQRVIEVNSDDMSSDTSDDEKVSSRIKPELEKPSMPTQQINNAGFNESLPDKELSARLLTIAKNEITAKIEYQCLDQPVHGFFALKYKKSSSSDTSTWKLICFGKQLVASILIQRSAFSVQLAHDKNLASKVQKEFEIFLAFFCRNLSTFNHVIFCELINEKGKLSVQVLRLDLANGETLQPFNSIDEAKHNISETCKLLLPCSYKSKFEQLFY